MKLVFSSDEAGLLRMTTHSRHLAHACRKPPAHTVYFVAAHVIHSYAYLQPQPKTYREPFCHFNESGKQCAYS